MKKLYFLFVLMMLNGLAFSQVSLPYAYNFDDASSLTEGWQSEFETPSNITLMLVGVVNDEIGAPVYSAPHSWCFSTYAQWSGGYNQYLISPRFSNGTTDSVQLRFRYCTATYDEHAEPFRIGYTTEASYNSPADFTWRTGVIYATSDQWQAFSVNLPADAQYIIIHYCPDGLFDGMYIDDILIKANSPGVEHSVFVSSNAGGTVSPSASVEDGDEYVLTVSAAPGHYIESVLLDGVALPGADHQTSFSYTISSVVADHSFTVTFAQIYYSISVSAGEHGSITPDGGLMSQVLVPWGHDTTFYFVGDEGYHVDDVLVDNSWHVGSIPSYTFTNVTSNHSISVSFAVNDYVITATAGAGGTISPSGNVGVAGLTNQSFVITPNPGYLIDTVYIDGEIVSGFTPAGWSYTFYNVTSAHSISAVFAHQQYEVTYACSSNGTVSVSGGDSIDDHTRRVYYEDVLEFSFLPNEGYQLSDIQIDGSSVAVQNPYQMTHVLQNSTLYADFSLQTYSIMVVKHGDGTVTPMSAVDSGYFATTAFTFTPLFCQQLDSLLLDGARIPSDNPCEFTHLVGEHQLDVYFGEIYYTMTAEPAEHGTLTAPQPVVCSGSAVFSLKADPCYQVSHFYLDGVQHDEYLYPVTTDSSVAIVPDCMGDHTASAQFTQKSYTLNVTATGNGTITHLGSQQVICGSQLAFTVTPDACSYVSMLEIDNVDVTSSVEHRPCAQAGYGDTLLFAFDDVQSAHNVQVTFAAITYTLSTQSVGLGTVSPTGETLVQCSENQVVEISPAACHHISGVWVDGMEVTDQLVYSGDNATFTFSDMRADHSLRAEFEGISYSISLQGGEHGTVIPSGDNVVACGDALQLAIVPDACYYADTVWIDGVVSTHLMQHRANVSAQTGDTLLYSFSNINENHVVTAHFAPIAYSISTTAIGNGQITGTVVSGTANCGDALAFTITPDDCYAISWVIYNGNYLDDYQVDENGVATFSIPSLNANVELSALFLRRSFVVEEIPPQHGWLQYPAGEIDCGEDVRIGFVAQSCYHLDSAYVDGVWYLPSQLSYDDEMLYWDVQNLHGNLTVSARFGIDSVHFAATGDVFVSVVDTMLACGQLLSCYSVIPDCKQLDSVLVNGVSMTEDEFRNYGDIERRGDTIHFFFPALTADCEFSVWCSIRQYEVAAQSVGAGHVDWPLQQQVACGDSIAIAIHADDCYRLGSVLNFGEVYPFDNDTLLVVNDVQEKYDWIFNFEIIRYSATLTSNEWGSIDGISSDLLCGADYEYKFSPDACGQLDSVWLDGQCVNDRLDTVGNVISFKINDVRRDFNLEARFIQNLYQVEVRNTEHATLNVPAVSMVACDSAYTLHVEVEDCYYLSDFLVNGVSQIDATAATLNEYAYVIPAVHENQVIELEYGVEMYSVRRQVRVDGNIEEDVFTEVMCGTDTLLSALWPDDCYSVTHVKINGVDTTVLDTYSFENIHHFIFLQMDLNRNIYHIDVQNVEHCQINAGSETNTFSCGEDANYWITTYEGYYVLGIVVDGDTLPADDHYEFENIHADHSLSVVLRMYDYALHCQVVGGEGEVTPADTILSYGTSIVVDLSPAACQHVDSVWVNGEYVGGNASYSLTILQNTNVEVKFVYDTNLVRVIAANHGQVSCVTDNPVVCGQDFSFNITPDDCYRISSVTLNGVEHLQDVTMTGNVGTFVLENVTANHLVKVSFGSITYPVTASFGEGGAVFPPSTQCVCDGDVLMDIKPEECYHIDSVFVNDVYVGTPVQYQFSHVTGDSTLRAVFARDSFSVVAVQSAGGSVSPIGTSWVTCGDNLTYTITPDAGHFVAALVIDGVTKTPANSYTFVNVTSDHTIEVVFGIYKYDFTVTTGSGGSILPASDVWVYWGEQQHFDIVPDHCYHIDSVFVDGVYYGNISEYTFTHVTAPHEISAVFARNVETITASAGDGGSIAPSGAVQLLCGDNQTFTIQPDECHYLSDILVNGVSVGANDTYTFENVDENQTIEAVFGTLVKQVGLSVVGDGGSLLPAGDTLVNCGDDLSVTITPAPCHIIQSILVNGEEWTDFNAAGDVYTFSNIRGDSSLIATFTMDVDTITVTANNAHGTVSSLGENVLECGSDFSVTFTPDDCYRVGSVRVDGVIQSSSSLQTIGDSKVLVLNDVVENHVVSVNFNQLDYLLIARTDGGGSISPMGALPFCGSSMTFTVEPVDCYAVDSVFVNGEYLPSSNLTFDGDIATFELTDIREDINIYVKFRGLHYQLNVANNGDGEVMLSQGGVDCDGDLTFSILPSACERIEQVLLNGEDITAALTSRPNVVSWLPDTAVYVITNVQANQDLVINYQSVADKQIEVNYYEGTELMAQDVMNVRCGSDTSLLLAYECYSITDLEVDGNPVSLDYQDDTAAVYFFHQILTDHALSATFERNSYSIMATAGEGGSISPNGTREVLCGGSQSYIITPNEGYYIAALTVDGDQQPAQGSWTFSDVRGDHTIAVTFSRYSYSVTTVAGEGGSAAPAGTSTVLHGDDLAVTIAPDDCYHIDSVFIDDVYSGAIEDYTFSNVTGNHTLSATFARNSYNIIATAGVGGNISPNGTSEVLCSGSQSYTITPEEGWYIATLTVDGEQQAAQDSWTFSDVRGNHTIAVTFGHYSYTVTATAGEGGSVSPAGVSSVEYGESLTVTIVPDDCFAIASIIVDGEEVADLAESYVFANVVENHTIDVTFSQIEYVLSSSVYLDGEEVLTDMGSALCGETAEVEIPLFECFHMDSLRVNGEWVEPVEIYFIENVRMEYVVEAFISDDIFYVESFVQGNGTISPSDTMVFCTSDVSMTITPDDCYHIDSVFIDGVYSGNISSYTFSDINENHTISATFVRDSYTVTATAGEGGSITPAGESEVLCGDSQSYTIIPEEGWYIATLTVDGEQQTAQNSWTFSDVRGDHTIAVTFGHYSYTVTATAGEGGSVSPVGTSSVEYGENLTVNITADDCYHIDSVFIDGAYAGAITSYTFSNITADHTLTATFVRDSYTVTATAGEGGSITPAGESEVLCGDSQSYTIIPEEGWYIATLTVDGEQQTAQNSWTFSDVRGDHTIAVTFGHYSYTVTATAGEGGSVSPVGTSSVEYGENLTVNITADDCYHIDSVFIDGAYAGAITSYTFSNITADHTLTATFVRDSYTVTATAGEGGSITPAGESEVLCGDSQSYTIIPEEGWYIATLTVDGEQQTAQNSWTFSDVRGDHTIAVTFGHYSYTVTATAGEGGSVSPVGTSSVEYGENLTVNITADDCYHIDSVFIDGAYAGAITSYTFSNITADHTLTATFVRDSYTVTATAGEGGSITPAGESEVLCGDSQSYTITPEEGYYIATLTVDGEQQDAQNSWTFSDVRGDHAITVTFGHYSYTITATAGEGGNVSPAGTSSVEYGESLTVNITADDCYHIDSVFVDGEYSGNISSYTFNNITQDHTITASFSQMEYSVSLAIFLDGEEVLSDEVILPCGDPMDVEVPVFDCYHIDSMRVNGEWVDPLEIYAIASVEMDYEVEAYLSADRFFVATSVQGSGMVLPADTIWASCEEDVTLTLIPETGWFVQNVIVDGQSMGTPANNSYTLVSISENHTVEVIFGVNQYIITSSVDPINAGQITPYGAQVYGYGDSVTYYIQPFPAYRIVRVEVDGEDVGDVDSYTFAFVDDHHTIVAYFETVGIDEVEASPMDIHVVNGELQVESNGHGTILSVEVFDLSGRCVARHGATGTMLQLPLPVATGVYVVRVVTTEATENRKVSITRW